LRERLGEGGEASEGKQLTKRQNKKKVKEKKWQEKKNLKRKTAGWPAVGLVAVCRTTSGMSTGRWRASAQIEFLEKQSCSSLANSASVKFLSAIQLTTLTPWILTQAWVSIVHILAVAPGEDPGAGSGSTPGTGQQLCMHCC
jgi:hypothetical protein